MKLINNIDLIRLPIQVNSTQVGQQTYQRIYFPRNIVYRDAKVSNIYVMPYATVDTTTGNNVGYPYNTFITLYAKDGSTICKDTPLSKFKLGYVTYVDIDNYVDWHSSYIYTLQSNVSYIYLYITYSDSYNKELISTQTVSYQLPSGETKLQNLIDSKGWGYLNRIDLYDAVSNGKDVWINLYDKDGRTFNMLNGSLLLVDGKKNCNNPLLFNFLNIDYQQSSISNNGRSLTIQFTFTQK